MNTMQLKRLALVSLALSVSLAVSICCSTSSAAASSRKAAAPATNERAARGLSGTWSGKYGGAYHGTFTLDWTQTGSRLSGTIKLSTGPGSKVGIKGTVKGSTISFGTVGSTAITYSGSVSGKSMSGKYQTPGGGGSWSAHKGS